jgi:hypothetical protein
MQKIIYGVMAMCTMLCSSLLAANKTHTSKAPAPVKVEVRKTAKGFELLRGGKPYFIKGAGGTSYYHRVAAYGGNSVRTWSTNNAKDILDSAQKNGLTVMMGLAVTPERHGFDYNDAAAVKKQFERIKAEVIKYKDHPALLTWGIGNELNLSYKNPKVWEAVNDIAKMIHEVDPNHPAMTVLAGINRREIDHIKASAPAIDILAINTYGGLAALPAQVKTTGWKGPYVVTEWGPTGHWEGLQTAWNAPVEETSSEKAAVYQSKYNYSMEKDTANCLGSYVFLWGQKQERTPTWYGLFTAEGEESEVIDVMQYLWTGAFPKNQAPHVYGFVLNGQKAHQSVYLKANTSYQAAVMATDPNNDPLTYRWELLPEATKVGEGGDHEDKPAAVNLAYKEMGNGKITVVTPTGSGAYRLFVYVQDGKNKVATANIPFYVK